MLVQSVSVFSLAVFLWALLPEIKWMMMMINCYEQLPIPLLDELCCTTALFIKNCLEAAVFVGFPKNKCNFLHKKANLAIVRRVQFLTGRRAVRSFSPAAVATIALLWKSAPIYGGRALQFGDVRT